MTAATVLSTVNRRLRLSSIGMSRVGRLIGSPLLAPFLVGLGALGFRAIGSSRSFELWGDELIYTDVGASVSHGHLPHLDGRPFFLHPPGAFLLEGGTIKLFGISGSSMSEVYQLRWLDAVLGALTVALAFLLVRKLSGSGAAWICAAILAFDPFFLRNNSRVFLETPGAVPIVGGYLVLVTVMRNGSGRISLRMGIVAGLLLGYGLLTKDAFAMLAVVPIVLAVLWRRTLPLREAAVVIAATAAPYLIYLIVVAGNGLFGRWWSSKLDGVKRMLGLKQITGFNAPHAPSLISRLIDQIGHFGTSYVLLIACPIAGLIAALSKDRAIRLIGLAAISMGLFGIYTALFGTFEEQYGYGVMIAGVLAIGAAAPEIRVRWPRREPLLRIAAVVLMVLTVGLGVRTESTADNGYQRLQAWIDTNLPATARVGITSYTSQRVFASDRRFGRWPSPESMQENRANYIITSSLRTSEGYGYAKPGVLDWLKKDGTALFTFNGPTAGDTTIWYVKTQQIDIAARQGVGS